MRCRRTVVASLALVVVAAMAGCVRPPTSALVRLPGGGTRATLARPGWSLAAETTATTVTPYQTFNMRVTLTNTGSSALHWRQLQLGMVERGVHWPTPSLSPESQMFVVTLAPGESTTTVAALGPLQPGAYYYDGGVQAGTGPIIMTPAVTVTCRGIDGLGKMGGPFSSYSLPVVSLAQGLAQMQRAVSLPDTSVAGVADAVMVSNAPKHANSLWVHYSKGIFLEIVPATLDGFGTGTYPTAAELTLRHEDGSRYLHFQQIAGRKTLIATAGGVVPQKTKSGIVMGAAGGEALTWAENGYVYRLQPSPPLPATFSLLIEVAKATK